MATTAMSARAFRAVSVSAGSLCAGTSVALLVRGAMAACSAAAKSAAGTKRQLGQGDLDEDEEKTARQLAMAFVRMPKKNVKGLQAIAHNTLYRKKIRLLRICLDDESKVADIMDFLDEDKENKASGGDQKSKPYWDDSVRQVARLPRYWMGATIVEATASLEEGDRWDAEHIRKIDKASDTNVSTLFQFLTGTHDSTTLPKSALRKETCRRVFVQMAKDLGRGKGLRKHVNMDGVIDWSKIGVYSFLNEDGGLCIQHCSGDVAKYPEHLSTRISEIALEKNANDLLAALRFPHHPFYLKDAFADGKGPKTEMLLNTKGSWLKELADRTEKAIADEEEQRKNGALVAADLQGDLSAKLASNAKEQRAAKMKARKPNGNPLRRRSDTVTVKLNA